MDEEKQLIDQLVNEFSNQRVSAWEFVHGLLQEEGRDCLITILACALKADPKTLIEALEEDRKNRGEQPPSAQVCYCQYLRKIQGKDATKEDL